MRFFLEMDYEPIVVIISHNLKIRIVIFEYNQIYILSLIFELKSLSKMFKKSFR